MLLGVPFATVLCILLLCKTILGEGTVKKTKPISLPLPLELPYRNERADQCWLRVEDVEVTETVAIFCTVAHGFLSSYIHDYNIRKMTEDGVDVSLWIEKPRDGSISAYGAPGVVNGIKNWKVTTVMDPITRRRIYVSKNADCKLIMYSREAVTNYNVDCDIILYAINENMSRNTGVAVSRAWIPVLVSNIILILFRLA